MRSAGAARRREQEQEPPAAGAAAAGAELRRVLAEADAALRRMSRRDREIESIAAMLLETGSACGNADRLAALADKLATRQSLQITETISCAGHVAEAREAAGQLAAAAAFSRAMHDAAIAEGRRREAGERGGQARAPGPRHARGRHLRLAGSAAVRATAVAAAAATATTMIASHDSASVRHLSAPRPAVVHLRAAYPDKAVLIPQGAPSSPPRPAAAAASARPAPPAAPGTPVPSLPPPGPPPPPSAAPAPVLSVPRFLDLGGSIRGQLPLTAGAQAVTWTAAATDGITLSSCGGVALAGQQVTITVTDPAGGSGWVYVSYGAVTIPVEITSALGAPAMP